MTNKSISFEEFKHQFIQTKGVFQFQLRNIKFTFKYVDGEYTLYVSDDVKEKVYHCESPEMLDLLSINNVPISEIWDHFEYIG